MNKNDIFSTRDLYLAATLTTLNFVLKTIDYQVEGERQRPIGYFGFDNTDKLQEFLQDYRQKKISVIPQDFVTSMRSLQSEVNNVYKNPHSSFRNNKK